MSQDPNQARDSESGEIRGTHQNSKARSNAENAPPSGPVVVLTSTSSLWLDGLRLLAAQAVVLGHAFDFFNWHSSLTSATGFQIQRLGVAVFFLLSGFLIPYSVAIKTWQRPSYGLSSYMADRTSRIYAGLVPSLVFIALVDALPMNQFEADYPSAEGSGSLWTWILNLLHLQEYPLAAWLTVPIPIFGSGDPLWSLAVEWWIYVLFGVLAFRSKSVLVLCLGMVAALSVGPNLIGGTGDGISLVWLFGWLCFRLWKSISERQSRLATARRTSTMLAGALASATLALLAVWKAPHRSHFGLDLPFSALVGLSILLLMLGLGHQRVERASVATASSGPLAMRLRTSPTATPSLWSLASFVRGGAGYSYTLYLTHFSVLTIGYEYREFAPPWMMVLASLLAANILALAVSFVGERHTKALRRWFYRRLSLSGTRNGP